MEPGKKDVGAVFKCGLDGTIVEVVRDELGIEPRIQPGRSLAMVVDGGSLGKSLTFLNEIKSHGSAFDWQLGVPIKGSVVILSFGGAKWEDSILVVAAKTSNGLGKLVDELTGIGNEQINSLRSALKERADLTKDHEQRENALYDKLGRLNNELANLQRELTKKNIELEKLNEEKNRFLGIAAHDLRNPLNAIQMYSEFLLEEAAEALDSEQMEFVSIIHSSSQFMLQLVNDLLDVAKIESGKLQLELTQTNLIEFIKRNLSLNSLVASRKKISLIFRQNGAIPHVMIDPAKINQVLNNLITNAIKFSAQEITVEVAIAKSGDDAVISVKDQGQGIPAEEIDKLFKPFQRTSVKTTAGEDSTGLGLAIVRRIVVGHRGKVWVESKVGVGSTFYVALPTGEI
ncbi:MAG: HAMP domain-containing sensor histidine kinase [Pseudomonadota bacterium]